MMAAGAFVYVNSTLLTFFIGVNLHFNAFGFHFNEIITEASQNPKRKCSNLQSLFSAIDFHNDVKR